MGFGYPVRGLGVGWQKAGLSLPASGRRACTRSPAAFRALPFFPFIHLSPQRAQDEPQAATCTHLSCLSVTIFSVSFSSSDTGWQAHKGRNCLRFHQLLYPQPLEEGTAGSGHAMIAAE